MSDDMSQPNPRDLYTPQYMHPTSSWRLIGVAESYSQFKVADDLAKEFAQRERVSTRVVDGLGNQYVAYDYLNHDRVKAPSTFDNGKVLEIGEAVWRLTDAQLAYIADAKDHGSLRYRIKVALQEAFNVS